MAERLDWDTELETAALLPWLTHYGFTGIDIYFIRTDKGNVLVCDAYRDGQKHRWYAPGLNGVIGRIKATVERTPRTRS